MSDIPLHTIRRQKPPEQPGIFHSYNDSMPTSRRTNNKRKGGLSDDFDEEAGLLDTQYNAEDEYDIPSESTPSITFFLGSSFATAPQELQKEPPTFSGSPAKDCSRTIPFNPSSMSHSTFRVNFYIEDPF